MLNSPSVVVVSGAEMEKCKEFVTMKTKVGVLRSNIVSNLPSVVVDSDAEKRKIQKIRPIKDKENKTILVISMATLPTVLAFSGAVNKKIKDKEYIKKIYIKKMISNVAY